jgi:hypothetical protein
MSCVLKRVLCSPQIIREVKNLPKTPNTNKKCFFCYINPICKTDIFRLPSNVRVLKSYKQKESILFSMSLSMFGIIGASFIIITVFNKLNEYKNPLKSDL